MYIADNTAFKTAIKQDAASNLMADMDDLQVDKSWDIALYNATYKQISF